MKSFELNIRTRVYFGKNITFEALKKERTLLSGNVIIITTGRSLNTLGYVEKLKNDILSLGSSEVITFENISPNPKLSEIKTAIELGKINKVNVVIGFGGGSAIDAAKAAAAGIGYNGDIEDFLFERNQPEIETLPIIAIPTTAGTGSELSKGAIISSAEHKIKKGIRGDVLLPSVAIVDTEYTYSVPKQVTMETGFDVLAHAVESYVSVKSNRFSEMLSREAIHIVGECLNNLREDLQNKAARDKMCYASMIMGINLANIGTCLPHRMQYPIGAITDTSHAAGLAALYPSWIMYEYDYNKKKINDIFKWLSLGEAGDGTHAKIKMKKYLEHLGLGYRLQDFGINYDKVKELSEAVSGNIYNDKLSEKKNIINTIFEDSI